MHTRPMLVALVIGLTISLGAIVLSATPRDGPEATAASQTGTSLSVDGCVEMDNGDTADVSIRISDVSDLTAWEIYFAYDRDLLEVVGRDVRLFLSQGPNSSVFDLSDPIPNSTGLYRLAAADVSLDAVPDSGSGVIAVVTVRSRAEGVSPAAIYRSSNVPLGPRLIGESASAIDDTSGDGIFDGTITNGQIAISRSCDPVAPTANPDIEEEFPPQPSITITITGGLTPTPGTNTSVPGDAAGATTAPADGGTSDATATASSGNAEDSDGQGSRDPTGLPDDRNQGDGGVGFGSSDDNTFWAIVLVGGGIALGLVLTYVFARVTRKPA